jgi:ADP-ribose pyrophosphatase
LTGKFDSVKVVRSRTVYDKRDRQVLEDVLEFADGSRYEWIYFKTSGAVAVAAFTQDNKMILTKQYRHPFRQMIYDLPAGGIEKGETSEQAALRELEEETGFSADKLEWIGRFTWAPGSMGPGKVEIFFTKSLKLKGSFNADEIAGIELVDFSSVLEKVLMGEHIDSALVVATLLISVRRLLNT